MSEAAPFVDMLGLPYVADEHPLSCGSVSRAVGKSGKRRLLPRPIPTLCDCGVRVLAHLKREQLRDAAPDLAAALESLLAEFTPKFPQYADSPGMVAAEQARAALRAAGRLP